MKADALLGLLLKNKHVQIAGPSGAGKTHLVKHMALFAQSQGHVVIFLQAKNYEGRLSDLLDFSIAHLHHRTSADLLQSCSKTSTPTALVVDGVNECPAKLLPNLLQELQAFYLRQPMPILITSQETIEVPQHLVGESMTSTDLTKQERQEILQCYSKLEISKELEALLEPFRTAFELSLAAKSASEITGPITRAGLFERYTRRCLGQTQDNTGVRQVLIDMAALMNHRLVTSLPFPEVERLAHAREGTKRDQLSLLKEVLSSSLLEFHPGLCSFRHEMFQNFFEAEALHRDHNDSLLLATELRRPQNRQLAEFVVGMAKDENLVRSCLHTLADIALLEQSLLGRLGNIPRQLAHKDGASIIQAALRALGSTEFIVPESLELRDPIRINGAPEWSSYESAVIRAIGRTLQDGVFIEEVLWLIQQTDQVSGLCVAEEGAKDQPSRRRSLLFEYLYVFEAVKWPTAAIVVHCHNDFRATGNPVVIDKVMAHSQHSPQPTPGQLYLVCLLLRGYRARGAGCTEKVESKLLELFRACWETRIYHLQLEALRLLQSYATVLEGQVRAQVENLLTSLNPRHLGLSTQLVETMSSYGLVESPVSSEDASKEIEEILRSRNDQLSQERAYGVVAAQFEDIFEGAYYTAIRELENAERVCLLTMAALAAPSYSFWLDWLLMELIKSDDTYALPALSKWATEIDSAGTFIQGTVAAFVYARIGCAKFLEEPPSLALIDSDDRRAWQTYGEIIFWTHKRGLSEDEIDRRCKPLWDRLRTDLRFEAVDPIMRISQSRKMQGDGGSLEKEWLSSSKEPVRQILEYGLAHRTQLSTLFSKLPSQHDQKDLTAFIISELGEIGTSHTIKVLEPLIDSEDFGVLAVEAVRKLKPTTNF